MNSITRNTYLSPSFHLNVGSNGHSSPSATGEHQVMSNQPKQRSEVAMGMKCNSYRTKGDKVQISKMAAIRGERLAQNIKDNKKIPNSTIMPASSLDSSEASRSETDASNQVQIIRGSAARIEPEDADRFKTELCRSWEELGRCKYGLRCKFAHGCQELRSLDRHPRYKTIPCRQFHTRGFCSYGSRCHFIHGETDRLLLAFLLTAVQLEKARQSHSKASSKTGNGESRKSPNKDKTLSRLPGGRVPNSIPSNRTLNHHQVHSMPVKTDELNTIAGLGSAHLQQMCSGVWDKSVESGSALSLADVQKFIEKNDFGAKTFMLKLQDQVYRNPFVESELCPTLLNSASPDRTDERQGFFWPIQPRSRTSSGESFGDDLDSPGGRFYSNEGMEECLDKQRRHQFILCKRQILENRLVDTLRQIKDLKLESSTLGVEMFLSKQRANVTGGINASAQKAFHENASVNVQLPRSSLLTSVPTTPGWNGSHPAGSSGSSASQLALHWLNLDENFEAAWRCPVAPRN